MRIDETAYNEYANWKLENEHILKALKKDAEDIYFRFHHVIEVVEYFYDKLIDEEEYSVEDDVIFKTGFYYLVDQFEELKSIFTKVYQDDAKELNAHAKEINLFLNAIDFKIEILNSDNAEDDDIKELLNFDEKIYDFINKKESIPNQYYEELDALSEKIFRKLEIEYFSISDIFLEIADELNVL